MTLDSEEVNSLSGLIKGYTAEGGVWRISTPVLNNPSFLRGEPDACATQDQVARVQAILKAGEEVVRRRTDSFVTSAVSVQAWEGVVQDVEENGGAKVLTVKLIDKTDRSAQDSFAQIDFREIDPDDFDLAVPGAVFYWYVSYEYRPSGMTRSSMIRFRRTPAWTANDLKRTKAHADELFKSLQIDVV
ncbi:hypothetical protein [Stenotrophomonas indicatrix]|uniref:hypothetical protein n=1 Tax=Stenotrophomonas indicatrix TaxID=2045451 RepID=UPI0032095B1E